MEILWCIRYDAKSRIQYKCFASSIHVHKQGEQGRESSQWIHGGSIQSVRNRIVGFRTSRRHSRIRISFVSRVVSELRHSFEWRLPVCIKITVDVQQKSMTHRRARSDSGQSESAVESREPTRIVRFGATMAARIFSLWSIHRFFLVEFVRNGNGIAGRERRRCATATVPNFALEGPNRLSQQRAIETEE